MNESPGYFKSLLIFVLIVGAGYQFIYKPAVNDLKTEKENVEKVRNEIKNASTVVIQADSTTSEIGKQALQAGPLSDQVADALPGSAISHQGNLIKVRYTAAPGEVAAAISKLTGSPFIDESGQLRGDRQIFKFDYQVKGEGRQSTLEGTISPVRLPASGSHPG